MKQQKGITLIALVITIIVLLILAGVSIAMISGNNSAPQKATEASQKDAIAAAKDEIAMQVQEDLLNWYDDTYVNSTATNAAKTAAATQDVVKDAATTAVSNVLKRNDELDQTETTVDDSKTADGTKQVYKIHLVTKSYTCEGKITDTGAIEWGKVTEK